MSTRQSRKRRRSQAFPSEDEIETAVENDEDDVPEHEESPGQARLDKERDVWDAFREEHFEAVDQMPLTLHRQFSLMRELDQQSHGYVADLLPTFHKYVARRMAMAQPNPVVEEVSTESVRPNNIPKQERLSTPPAVFSIDIPIGISPSKLGPSTPLRKLRADSTPATPMGIPPERVKPPQTTREMLSHIAWLSEELLRTSEEKVNLAQAAYDSVDRHIRLLDQAIKEQEASISLGIRPGTHLAPIILPDLIPPPPRTGRPSRITLSPDGIGDFHDDADGSESDGGVTLGITVDGAVQSRIPPRRRKGKKGLRRPSDPAKDFAIVEPGRRETRSLKITLPPPQSVLIPGDMPIDPNESRYCYCNQVSFGVMIACDDSHCEREWFHLGCTNLTEAPGGKKKWYCDDCTAKRNHKRR